MAASRRSDRGVIVAKTARSDMNALFVSMVTRWIIEVIFDRSEDLRESAWRGGRVEHPARESRSDFAIPEDRTCKMEEPI